MFGFIIKKSFYDGWDNLYQIVVSNMVCMFAALGLSVLLRFAIVSQSFLIIAAAVIVFSIILSILVFAFGESAASIANFEGTRIADYFINIPSVLKDAVLFGLLCSGIGLISFIGVTYYWGETFMGQFPMLGIFLGAVIIWVDLFIILALQWFLPIRSLMKNNFRKCLKKSFLILLDNTGFSILMFLHNIVCAVISVFCIGFVPSFSGISISMTNALRLRLYKYDYLEEHPELTGPGAKRKPKIPWEELIYDDRETFGTRKLKNLFFPWREDKNK